MDWFTWQGLSHERNVSPKSVVTVGEEIKWKFLTWTKKKVVYPFIESQPLDLGWRWTKVAAGDVIEGTVKRLTDFGAFVEVPVSTDLYTSLQISTNVLKIQKIVLKVGQSSNC